MNIKETRKNRWMHLSAGRLFAPLAMGAITALMLPATANANEIDLKDYDLIEEVGAAWEYEILDSNGQVVGDISKEVTGEVSGGNFETLRVSNLDNAVGRATFIERYNAAGERIVERIEFSTEFNGTVIDSNSKDYDPPTENFASLTQGEEAVVRTTFTATSTDPLGQTQTRTGSLETTMVFEAAEEIEVPAGTFDTVRIRIEETTVFDDAPDEPEVERRVHWYANGVGRVKQAFPDRQPDESHHEDVLVNYSLDQSWYATAAETDNGWRFYDWFKGFNPQEQSNWIYHGRHGWLFVIAEDTSRMFLWDAALGRWMFTNENVYPWMYAFGPDQGWVFFFENGQPGSRYFQRGDTNEVVSENDLSTN